MRVRPFGIVCRPELWENFHTWKRRERRLRATLSARINSARAKRRFMNIPAGRLRFEKIAIACSSQAPESRADAD